MITSLQIMNKHQRNSIHGVNFIDLIKQHTMKPNAVYAIFKNIIIIYDIILGKDIQIDPI